MDTDLPQRYDKPVPRYTSYPTAPHFRPGVTAVTYRDWLASVADDQSVSQYFHVPFCARMCCFCGCHTKVVRQYRPVADYASLLRREVRLVADAIPMRRVGIAEKYAAVNCCGTDRSFKTRLRHRKLRFLTHFNQRFPLEARCAGTGRVGVKGRHGAKCQVVPPEIRALTCLAKARSAHVVEIPRP